MSRLWPLMDVAVRTESAPDAVVPDIRRVLHTLDPDMPMATVRTMDDWVSANAAQPRLDAVLLTAFAGVALLIAAIGVYGILAYSVSQRTREIGLRMALGAARGRVLGLVVREGMVVGLSGIAVGLAAALALSQALQSLVYGVAVRDVRTFVSVAAVLGLVALAACFLPAHRASRVDPMIALRAD
jgi:putative ABC transport system permease protein